MIENRPPEATPEPLLRRESDSPILVHMPENLFAESRQKQEVITSVCLVDPGSRLPLRLLGLSSASFDVMVDVFRCRHFGQVGYEYMDKSTTHSGQRQIDT